MKKMIVVSDFDGTITKKDSLYSFFEKYASDDWLEIERLWSQKKISSKECLLKEFELVKNLSPELVNEFIKTMEIDEFFKSSLDFLNQKNIDFVVVSDGIDYFIKNILKRNNIENVDIITNKGEFIDNKFVIDFPNDSKKCILDSGTCKCAVIEKLREKYEKIIYIGDGTSDFCVSNKADFLFAKKSLKKYCDEKKIKYIEYENYNDVINKINRLFFQ